MINLMRRQRLDIKVANIQHICRNQLDSPTVSTEKTYLTEHMAMMINRLANIENI